jgi:two-component system, NtrC family, response regulator
MTAYDWPGNVRELENRIKRAVVMTERRRLDPADLELAPPPPPGVPDLDLRSARLRAEHDVIREALIRSNTVSEAARILGVSQRYMG